jgi:acetylornithine deacetylase/succinyl-diaminopimelate desuccinylase-like protein
MSDLQKSLSHARTHQAEYLEQYKELLAFPTIGADPAYREDIVRAAGWIAADMQRIGLTNCQVLPSEGNPLVYGEWLEAGSDQPTVLVYAHYDVQPVDPLDLWVSPPFEPTIREGNLYARGSIDDKSGVHVNLKAVESMLAATGRLPVNMKFLFEGEEESGSPNMAPWLEAHKDLLQADILIVSDGSNDNETPLIMVSARGIVSAEVRLHGPVKDLHSGSYGGVVHNPAHLAARIIAAFHDENGRIRIPGFYDNIRPLTDTELAQMKAVDDWTMTTALRETGLTHFWGPAEIPFQVRQTAQPTCEVNGMKSGYQGEGEKTIIPAEASFKVTMRTVADQDPDDLAEKFTRFVHSFDCPTIKIDCQINSAKWPFQGLTEGPVLEALQKAYETTYGRRGLLIRAGGSVPIIGDLSRILGMPLTSLSCGNGDNGHSPNEFIRIKYYHLGIETVIHFLYNLAGNALQQL